jgi:hypothetical protein
MPRYPPKSQRFVVGPSALEAPGLSTSNAWPERVRDSFSVLLPPKPRGPDCKALGWPRTWGGTRGRYEPAARPERGGCGYLGPSSTAGKGGPRDRVQGLTHFRAACGEGSQARGSDQTKAGSRLRVILVGPRRCGAQGSRHRPMLCWRLRPWSRSRPMLTAKLGVPLGTRRATSAPVVERDVPASAWLTPVSMPRFLRRSVAGRPWTGIARSRSSPRPESAGLGSAMLLTWLAQNWGSIWRTLGETCHCRLAPSMRTGSPRCSWRRSPPVPRLALAAGTPKPRQTKQNHLLTPGARVSSKPRARRLSTFGAIRVRHVRQNVSR